MWGFWLQVAGMFGMTMALATRRSVVTTRARRFFGVICLTCYRVDVVSDSRQLKASKMYIGPRSSLSTSILFSLVLTLGSPGCSHSRSADEDQPANSTGRSDSSVTVQSSSGGRANRSSSDRAYRERSEVEKLREKTQRLKVQAEILEIENTIQLHYVLSDSKDLPDDLSELTEGEKPAIENPGMLRDPWGNQYIYRNDGGGRIEVYSAGPDGEPGNDDDIRSSE